MPDAFFTGASSTDANESGGNSGYTSVKAKKRVSNFAFLRLVIFFFLLFLCVLLLLLFFFLLLYRRVSSSCTRADIFKSLILERIKKRKAAQEEVKKKWKKPK